jgi:hypothetical protein
MKEFYPEITLNGKNYLLCFNLNVMEAIQDKYETIDKWSDLTAAGDAKAIKFGFAEMLNEGIDIMNEKEGIDEKPFTLKQVGRLLTEIGFQNVGDKINEAVLAANKDESKNV